MDILALFAGVTLTWVAFRFLLRFWSGEYCPPVCYPRYIGALSDVMALGCFAFAAREMRGGSDVRDVGLCGSPRAVYDF